MLAVPANSTSIMRTANLSETEKSSSISNALEHLRLVKLERSHYKSIWVECKESVRAHFVTDGRFTPPPPSSHNTLQLHGHQGALQFRFCPPGALSFQPGPIYFLTPQKCTVFGVNCEAVPRQINFLTDEV